MGAFLLSFGDPAALKIKEFHQPGPEKSRLLRHDLARNPA
jgi:hypothetical protein